MRANFKEFNETEFVKELVDRSNKELIKDDSMIETLCSFEDFQQFKELVIQYKKGNLNPENAKLFDNSSWNPEVCHKLINDKSKWVSNFVAENRQS